MPVGGWRVAARLARRELRHRPGRTALVAALVAIPVAGMLVGVALLRSGELSSAENWRLQYGLADAAALGDPVLLADAAPLPAGSRTIDFVQFWPVVETAGGKLCRCQLSDMPVDPLTDGLVRVTAGDLPRSDDEVLLTAEAAHRLDIGLGDRFELTRPVTLDATVVGIGRWSRDPDIPLVLVHEGSAVLDSVGWPVERQQLVDLPDAMTSAERAAWEARPGPYMRRDAALSDAMGPAPDADADVRVRWTWAGGAAGLTVLGIVITAAFAAGARRQFVTLGQLAANGAPPALLRRVLFLQGSMTGLVGALVGLVAGGLILAGCRPWADQLLGHAFLGWDVPVADVLPIVALAVLAATVAAMIPAFGASRVSVLTALAGRRPLRRPSHGRTVAGLVVTAAGVTVLGIAAHIDRTGGGTNTQANALSALAPVLMLLGVCAAMPAYVTVLHPLARFARGPWRLASRSLLRQRTRTSALVASVCSISAGAVAVAALGLGVARADTEPRPDAYVPDGVVRIGPGIWGGSSGLVLAPADALEKAADEAAAVLPDAERYDLAHAVDPADRSVPPLTVLRFTPDASGSDLDDDMPASGSDGLIPVRAVIADDELERAYEIDSATQRRLDDQGAVWFGPADGVATIATATQPGFEIDAAAVGPDHRHGLAVSDELLLTAERAADLGLVAAPAEVVLRAPERLTGRQSDALGQVELRLEADAQETWPAGPPADQDQMGVALDYVGAPRSTPPGLVETVPAAVALLFALAVVAVGLALAAAESAEERDVLVALGAPPRTMRRTNAAKALLLTLLGVVVALPVGLGPVLVISRLAEDGSPFVVPWRTIGLLVVVVPLLAAAMTAAGSRHRGWQVSTATFE